MKKLGTVLSLLGLIVASALVLGACGSSSSSSGKEGGTLKLQDAAAADYLDPQLSYTADGWTEMWNTYVPLLTYKHASGTAGSTVIPGLAESLPKITNGGKTYTLTLRKGLKYSDGTPVKASDFPYAVKRMFVLDSGGSAFYTDIVGAAQFQKTKKGEISGIKTDDATGKITINLTEPRGTFNNELALMFVAPVPQNTPMKDQSATPIPGDRSVLLRLQQPAHRLHPGAQPAVGEEQREGDGGDPERPRRQDRAGDQQERLVGGGRHAQRDDQQHVQPTAAGPLRGDQVEVRGHPVPARGITLDLLLLDELQEPDLQQPEGPTGDQLRGRSPGAGADLQRPDGSDSADPAADIPRLQEVHALPAQPDQGEAADLRVRGQGQGHHRLDR